MADFGADQNTAFCEVRHFKMCLFDVDSVNSGCITVVELYQRFCYGRNFSKLRVPGCFDSQPQQYTTKQAHNLKFWAGKNEVAMPFTV